LVAQVVGLVPVRDDLADLAVQRGDLRRGVVDLLDAGADAPVQIVLDVPDAAGDLPERRGQPGGDVPAPRRGLERR
jgi:hypothetical protein